jgi:PAS domain S-box-containing protein
VTVLSDTVAETDVVELLRHIKSKACPDTVILLIVGAETSSTVRAQSLRAGVSAYAVRPVCADELLALVEEAANGQNAGSPDHMSQAQLATFLEQASDGFVFLMLDEPIEWSGEADKDELLAYALHHLRVTHVSDTLLTRYGVARDGALGLAPREFVAGVGQDSETMWRKLFDDGSIVQDAQERQADGTPFHVQGRFACLYTEDGRIAGVCGVQRDITAQRQAELALRQSNAVLVALRSAQARFMNDGDPQAAVEDLLQSMLSLTGSQYGFIGEVVGAADKVPGLRVHAVRNLVKDETHPSGGQVDPDRVIVLGGPDTLLGQSIASGKAVAVTGPETEALPDELVPARPALQTFLGLPFFSGGDLVGIVGVANRAEGYDPLLIDSLAPFLTTCASFIVAQRSQRLWQVAERGLQQSEQQLQAILRAAPVGIGVIADRVIGWANETFHEMLGYADNELSGVSTRLLYETGEEFERVGQVKYAGATQWGEGSIETRFVRKDGRVIDVLLSSCPVDAHDPMTGLSFAALDITERKRAEEGQQRALAEALSASQALRESEERYRLLVESQNDLVIKFDAKWRLLFVSPSFCRTFDCMEDEILGKELLPMIHPEDHERVRASLQTLKLPPHTCYHEVRALTKDGLRWLAWSHRAILDEQGAIREVIAVGRDVTQRKWTERTLRHRTEQLEALREVGLSLTTELDLDALLHSIVSHAVELWGCRVGSLYLHRPDKDLLELVVIIGAGSDLIGVTLRRGEGLAGEIWKTGEPLSVSEQRSLAGQPAMPTEENPFSFAGVPIRWGDEFLGVLDLVSDDPGAFSSDDTELLSLFASQASIAIKNARLFQAERRRSSEAEALRKASLVLGSRLDPDWVLVQLLEQIEIVIPYDCANVMQIENGVARITQQRGYERMGTSEEIAELRMPVEDYANLHRMFISRRPRVVRDTTTDPGWTYIAVTDWIRSWAAAPIIVRDKVIAFLCLESAAPGYYHAEHADLLAAFAAHAGLAIDNARLMSQTQAALDELRQAQSQLVHSAKMAAVGELAAGVAHELNNPLTSVLGFSQLMLRSTERDDPAYQNLSTIVNESMRARHIVRDLLDFSRQSESYPEPANVNDVVRSGLDLVRGQAETSGVIIVEEYEERLPPLILATGRMKQVFLNLFTNAIQAMPGGGELLVRSEKTSGSVAIRIADTGSGIDESIRARIFEPFFTTKQRQQGTGLGLSVSLGIVEEHGGRITLTSEPGAGSIFTVWLPLEPEVEEREVVLGQ